MLGRTSTLLRGKNTRLEACRYESTNSNSVGYDNPLYRTASVCPSERMMAFHTGCMGCAQETRCSVSTFYHFWAFDIHWMHNFMLYLHVTCSTVLGVYPEVNMNFALLYLPKLHFCATCWLRSCYNSTNQWQITVSQLKWNTIARRAIFSAIIL